MSSVHRQTFTAFVQSHGWTRGAELGVDKGILFGMLLKECPSLHLIGVDTFPDAERSHRVPQLVAQFQPRARLLSMRTNEAAKCVPDGSLDFCFIDADHSEAAVLDDIEAWTPKVRDGGWLGGHDYCKAFKGVMRAVKRTFPARDVSFLPGTIWGVWR